MHTLLDPEIITVEQRIVDLPHSGEVMLSVLHTTRDPHPTMDLLEHTVRSQEEFMVVPVPKEYIGVVVVDATPQRGGGGASGVLTIDPGGESDASLIGHEFAHTYWSFSPTWIAEGGADFMTTVPAGVEFSDNECGLVDNLEELVCFTANTSGRTSRVR